jgi:hypothetical protein
MLSVTELVRAGWGGGIAEFLIGDDHWRWGEWVTTPRCGC